MRQVVFAIVVFFPCVVPSRSVAQSVDGVFVTITDDAFKSTGAQSPHLAKGESISSIDHGKGDSFRAIYLGPHGMAQGWVARSDVIPFAESFDFLTNEVRRNPTAAAYLHRVHAWVYQGDIENALADCNQAIRLEPKNATAYVVRGGVWQGCGNDEKAVADLNTAIRLDPKEVTAHFTLARHWDHNRQFEKAISEYDKVLQIDPTFPSVETSRANAAETKSASDKAIAECEKLIAQDPTNADAFRRRAVAWMARGARDKAIADWSAAIRLEPHDVSAYKTRGSAWLAAGQYDKAIADWSAAIRIEPDLAIAYANRAFAWMKQGATDKALADWNEAIRLKDSDATSLSNRGSAWKEKGQYDQAIADYAEAIRHDRDCGEAYLGLAEIHAACPDARYRNGALAVENAVRAIELLGRRESEQLLVAAAAYAEIADFESACKWQEMAIHRAPEKSKAKYREVLALYKSHKPLRETR